MRDRRSTPDVTSITPRTRRGTRSKVRVEPSIVPCRATDPFDPEESPCGAAIGARRTDERTPSGLGGRAYVADLLADRFADLGARLRSEEHREPRAQHDAG